MRSFLATTWDPSEKAQEEVKKKMQFKYHNRVGELILYDMIACCLDLSYTIVCVSQYRVCQQDQH